MPTFPSDPVSGQVDEAGREGGMSLARELITWRLTEGEDEGPKYVAREAAQLIDQPMLMVGVVMALVEALAVTFGTVEEWRDHIVAADLGESIDGEADDYWQARIDRANQMHDSLERQRDEALAEVAGLRTHVSELVDENTLWRRTAVRCADERDVLAGQVAAILALCDQSPKMSDWGWRDGIRAALVASSPTTRPTRPESTSPSRTALDPEAKK